ncbi:DUF418 domain-containing protein [Aquimarina sp. RZ0]|uniref:DUF418 domain-containing protein n=1 Tax=Aquimarina sp. RZ0 TaxID=2607730 RepID=UPI0011F37386|nr:DUF418 domain-containing protein [Aquimarina sp. RZ0]KAA1247458.1 DUF418 domain-containing protein [Aquimarina sp. RZ0]
MPNKPRIKLIDALRGLAISGILLLHHIEHFDFYVKPDYTIKWLVKADQWIWNTLFDLVSGKAFALFSLLFGISFWIIHENHKERNQEYFYRHFWRMIILMLIGGIHLIFFRGDILIMYALLGFPLIFSKYLGNKSLITIAVILLVNPLYVYNLITYVMNWDVYDFRVAYPEIKIEDVLKAGTFKEVLKMNFMSGYLITLIWSWNVGRFFTILGLFYLGVLFRKTKFLTEGSIKVWYKIVVISILFVSFFSFLNFVWIPQITDSNTLQLMKSMIDTYAKLSLMFLFLSVIVILWRHNSGEVWITQFINFGRMGLTNYVLMSIIGSVLYYNWGFGLYASCGSLFSLIIGLACLWGQMLFSSWWLHKYDQGPLEKVWRKLTWRKVK